MFSSISWGQYITAIIVVLAGYYLYVGYKYFQWEILAVIGIKRVEDNSITIPVVEQIKIHKVENPEDYLPRQTTQADITPLVQAFTDEVSAYITEAKTTAPKQEILFALHSIASKYPVLKGTDVKEELLHFVYTEVNNKYPDCAEPDELKQIWV